MNTLPENGPVPKMIPASIQHTDPQSAYKLSQILSSFFSQVPAEQPILFVCIGTDRSTGDSLGPLIGSRLRKYNETGISLYGTLDHPVHAMNLEETIEKIHKEYEDPYIVGIDACLGQLSGIGTIKTGRGPIKPGAGVNKELPSVGHMHITGIVNVSGFMEYFVLQNTRLSLVMRMAETIAKAIYLSLVREQRLTGYSAAPSWRIPVQ